jgi:hypothetical protein
VARDVDFEITGGGIFVGDPNGIVVGSGLVFEDSELRDDGNGS